MTTSLCLFACYSKSDVIFKNTMEYLRQLALHFDKVLVLTNRRNTQNGHVTNEDALPSGCELQYVEETAANDFGMFHQILHTYESNATAPLTRLGLVNDSCYIVNDLHNTFARAKRNRYRFWGLLKSEEIAPHIQSFFVVADGTEAVDTVLEFFREKELPPKITRDELIRNYEIGLSLHMLQKGFDLESMYSMKNVLRACAERPLPPNASVFYWDTLLVMGYPLLKRKRKFLLHHTAVLHDWVDPYFMQTMIGMEGDVMF